MITGEGLSGPAIAGIAAGIPCSLLFLLLLGGFIYLCVYCHKNRSKSSFSTRYLIMGTQLSLNSVFLCVVGRQTRYPVSRAVEKVRISLIYNYMRRVKYTPYSTHQILWTTQWILHLLIKLLPRSSQAITIQPDTIPPHNLLTGGLKSLPDYNRLQQVAFQIKHIQAEDGCFCRFNAKWTGLFFFQTPSERSVALPSFVPPAPVRVATTVWTPKNLLWCVLTFIQHVVFITCFSYVWDLFSTF